MRGKINGFWRQIELHQRDPIIKLMSLKESRAQFPCRVAVRGKLTIIKREFYSPNGKINNVNKRRTGPVKISLDNNLNSVFELNSFVIRLSTNTTPTCVIYVACVPCISTADVVSANYWECDPCLPTDNQNLKRAHLFSRNLNTGHI